MRFEMERHLREKLIPFWQGLRDDANGGYIGGVDFDLNRIPTAEKGCILNSRILWFFSNAYMALHDEALLNHATHAYRFLTERCVDAENGGVYWSVTYDGKPLDTTKHTYNQAFAIYALSSYTRATGNKDALHLAHALMSLIESHSWDGIGYKEAFTRDFRPDENDKLSENGVIADKTMNTLLHVMEAYTELYVADPSPALATKLRELLQIVLEHVYDPDRRRLNVFFDAAWKPIIDLQSYGHDIEASWLIDRAAEVLHDQPLYDRIHAMTAVLAASVRDRAFDGHSVYNEKEGDTLRTLRVWWVQAEAVLGFMHHGYTQEAEHVWAYIQQTIVDSRPGGEWYADADDDGGHSSRHPIVEPWKCPYHNGRMCLEIMAQKRQASQK